MLSAAWQGSTRPAGEISLMEVLTALEGSFLQIGPEGSQDLPSVRVQQEVWQKVHDEAHKILVSTSVHDLLERERALTAPPRYVI